MFKHKKRLISISLFSNIKKIKNYFDTKKDNLKPNILIANTIKGKGFDFSENNNEWHHSVMTKSIYEKGLKQIK